MKGYRCSCCNELKKEGNKVWKNWDDVRAVLVCRTCANEMKKGGYTDVPEYLDSEVSYEHLTATAKRLTEKAKRGELKVRAAKKKGKK